MSLCNCSHQFCKNIPVSFDFITTWNQGVFLCSPCITTKQFRVRKRNIINVYIDETFCLYICSMIRCKRKQKSILSFPYVLWLEKKKLVSAIIFVVVWNPLRKVMVLMKFWSFSNTNLTSTPQFDIRYLYLWLIICTNLLFICKHSGADPLDARCVRTAGLYTW